MSHETRLNEILDRWDELQAAGESPTPEELCVDDPILLDELRQRIATLREMDAILRDNSTATGSEDAERVETVAIPKIVPAVSPYSALEFHARGGLGEVFRARDDHLKRDVAIKLVRSARAGSPEGRLRFEREAEVTGRLEHPGIAPVHTTGRCDDGRPYYVMRFIDGETLGDAIRRNHSPGAPTRDAGEASIAFRDLLNRFVQVCKTIEYAHGRGVLHRDIKPSNVMLGPYGETLVVDWGLAKLTAEADPGSDRSASDGQVGPQLTATGSALGTPAFMAPEQLGGEAGQLSPATDVYGLGATLYFLLTGHAPFEGGDLASVQDRVRRGDFPSPRDVNRSVPRALDAVCLRAMSVHPGDRYASSGALAVEIERWLANEPVSAWREPWNTRAARWARRHRPLVTGAAASLAVLTVALGVSTILLSRANQETRNQERIARQNLEEARHVVSDMFEKVVPRLPDLKDMDEAQREILERALAFYSDFVLVRGQTPEARHELGRAYLQLGIIRENLNQTRPAEQSLREGKSVLDALLSEHPNDPGYETTLASILNRLGHLYIRTGRPVEAELAMREGLSLDERLAAQRGSDAKSRDNLARSAFGLGAFFDHNGRLEEAEAAYNRAANFQEALVREDPEVAEYRSGLAKTLYELGWVIDRRGRGEQAMLMYERLVEIQEKLVADHPLSTSYMNRLTATLSYLGALYGRRGRMAMAERAHQRAISIQEELLEAHPGVFHHLHDLAGHFLNLGNHYQRVARPLQAEELHRKALHIYEQAVRTYPDQVLYRTTLGNCLNNIGGDIAQRGAFRDAIRSLDLGIQELEAVLSSTPRQSYARKYLSGGFQRRASAHYRLGEYRQSLADLDRAAELDEGDSRDVIRALRALVLGRMGDRAGALAVAKGFEESSRDGAALYFAAALHASLSAGPNSDAEDHGARAMSLLTRARATGLFALPVNLKEFMQDPDFDTLRTRPDFQAFTADVAFPEEPFSP